jgi:hypothetical protein
MYVVAALLALAAVVCAVVAFNTDMTYFQFIAIGLVCATVASLTPLFTGRT